MNLRFLSIQFFKKFKLIEYESRLLIFPAPLQKPVPLSFFFIAATQNCKCQMPLSWPSKSLLPWSVLTHTHQYVVVFCNEALVHMRNTSTTLWCGFLNTDKISGILSGCTYYSAYILTFIGMRWPFTQTILWFHTTETTEHDDSSNRSDWRGSHKYQFMSTQIKNIWAGVEDLISRADCIKPNFQDLSCLVL